MIYLEILMYLTIIGAVWSIWFLGREIYRNVKKKSKQRFMSKQITIGTRVKLKQAVDEFPEGHEFTVYGPEGMRGWNLVDDSGKKLDETAMISHLLEPIS